MMRFFNKFPDEIKLAILSRTEPTINVMGPVSREFNRLCHDEMLCKRKLLRDFYFNEITLKRLKDYLAKDGPVSYREVYRFCVIDQIRGPRVNALNVAGVTSQHLKGRGYWYSEAANKTLKQLIEKQIKVEDAIALMDNLNSTQLVISNGHYLTPFEILSRTTNPSVVTIEFLCENPWFNSKYHDEALSLILANSRFYNFLTPEQESLPREMKIPFVLEYLKNCNDYEVCALAKDFRKEDVPDFNCNLYQFRASLAFHHIPVEFFRTCAWLNNEDHLWAFYNVFNWDIFDHNPVAIARVLSRMTPTQAYIFSTNPHLRAEDVVRFETREELLAFADAERNRGLRL